MTRRTRSTRRILIVGDVHVPNHDEEAVAVALAVIRAWQPDEVHQAGDLCEAGQLSQHPRRSRSEDRPHPWLHELEIAGAFWDDVREAAPGAECHWRLGNHEGRLERELMRLPWGADAADRLGPQSVVGDCRPWLRIHPYARRTDAPPHKILPDLVCPHGAAEGTHATAKHLDLFTPFSVVHGHTHRVAHVVRRLADGRHQHALSPGCLARRQPAWAGERPTGHAHGLALVTVPEEGSWGACVVTIEGEDGRRQCVLPWGEAVRA